MDVAAEKIIKTISSMTTANSLQSIEQQLSRAIELCNGYLKTNTTENIEVELTDDEFLFLARQAHDLDITLNQLVNNILLAELERIKNE